MIFGRTIFFIVLLAIIITPFIGYKLWWIAGSKETTGTMRFVGKEYSGQLVRQYAVIRFFVGKDTFWFHGVDNMVFDKGQTVPVRYRKENPSDAHVNGFSGIWIEPLIYASPFLLVLIIVFLHPDLVPRQSRIRIADQTALRICCFILMTGHHVNLIHHIACTFCTESKKHVTMVSLTNLSPHPY